VVSRQSFDVGFPMIRFDRKTCDLMGSRICERKGLSTGPILLFGCEPQKLLRTTLGSWLLKTSAFGWASHRLAPTT